MASEQKQTRLRQGSVAADRTLALHLRQPSRQAIKPKSVHTEDPFLADFLRPSCDPAEYLNSMLPPLQVSGQPATSKSGQQAVPLTELANNAQDLTSQLDAHMTRLSETLTQLTDEILRCGSRLEYQVELFRGEALGLVEVFSDGLTEDIEHFVPGGVQDILDGKTGAGSAESRAHQRRMSVVPPTPRSTVPPTPRSAGPQTPKPPVRIEDELKNEPPYLQELYQLTVAKSRLQEVIKTFGNAMDFVFPPSEMSVSSSFLSVSAPEPGSTEQSSEEKGQQVLKGLRTEVSTLLADSEDPVRGIEKAAQRVEEIKELVSVWKGTAEERPRTKFVESLAKMVEDRHRELLKEMEQRAKVTEEAKPRKGILRTTADPDGGEQKVYGGYNLLQRFRGL